MIIGMLNQKGGVGKTTLSVNLASAFAEDGAKVMLIDADTQATARDWDATRILPKKFRVQSMTEPALHKHAGEMRRFDHVIIDAPPRWGSNSSMANMARSIVAASDLILIPVRPSAPDIWASKDVVTLVEEARERKPSIKAAFLVNCRQVNTKLAGETDIVLTRQVLPTMKAMISNRTSVAWTFSRGYSVFDMKKERRSAEEIGALKREIVEMMKQK